ncbi:MAG: PrsW family intramembrane metalloprotease [bacterium]|nr:PrsW family intramembrane metalloprotease [bacterium]
MSTFALLGISALDYAIPFSTVHYAACAMGWPRDRYFEKLTARRYREYAGVRTPLEIFSLSFLDCIYCGLGAVLIILLMYVHAMRKMENTVPSLRARISMLSNALVNLNSRIAVLSAAVGNQTNTILQLSNAWMGLVVECARLSDELRLAQDQVPVLGDLGGTIQQQLNLIQSLSNQLRQAQNTRTILGIPIAQKRLVFLIVISGSMKEDQRLADVKGAFKVMLASIYLFGLFSCATVVWFVYRLCGKRQPWWYMVAPAVFTAVMTIPVLVVLHALFRISPTEGERVGFVQRFLEHTFITGVSEEFVKILPLLVVIVYMQMKGGNSRRLAIREPLDGILLAASSAIGFVVLETIFLYCNPENVRTDYQAWAALQLLIPRIFASVGGHVAYSGYFGYFIGLGMQHKTRFWQYALIGYACAAVCHGLWNSVLPFGTPAMIIASSIAYFLFMAAILRARATSQSALRQTVYGVSPRSL